MLKNFFEKLTSRRALLIIAITGFIVFANSLFNNFIGDDFALIVEDPRIHSIQNIPAFFTGANFYNAGGKLIGIYYKPLMSIYFGLVYSVFGPGPFWFHFLQIVLHTTNSLLIFLFFKKFFKKPLAFVLSLIFLIHPINSEAVYSIAAVQEQLFFFFGISGMLFLANAKSFGQFIFTALLLFLSLLSKETGILFVFAGAIFTLMFNKKHLVKFLLATALFIIVYAVLRINAVGLAALPANAPIAKLTLTGRLLNLPAIFAHYLETFFIPINLLDSQQWVYKEVTLNNFVFPLVAVVIFLSVVFFSLYRLYQKRLYPQTGHYLFYCLLFLAGISLHLQIIPLDSTVADRWFYFPAFGLLGMLGVVLESVAANDREIKLISLTPILIILAFSIRTFIRGFDWRDDLTLAAHDNKVIQSYVLENIIGKELRKLGQLQEAKSHLEKSVELYPYSINLNNLGLTYLSLGDYQKAKEAYVKALEFGDWYLVYENLAGLSLVYGEPRENIGFIKLALAKFPEDSKLWLYLAILEYEYGDEEMAKSAITNAISLSQNEETTYVYTKIINNQPLQLNFQLDNVDVQNKK